MNDGMRWDRCIWHRGRHVKPFLTEYLGQSRRRALVIGGAGFDPRATVVPELVARVAPSRARGYFIREDRPGPDPERIRRAQANEDHLLTQLPGSLTEHVPIFASDGAVIGGRAAVASVNRIVLDETTDIFVDLSALSIGVAFPIVRHLFARVHGMGSTAPNLHVVVTDEPATDSQIASTAGDFASTIHGFKGGWGLDFNSQAAKLWIPQLSRGKKAVLERIHLAVQPHAVCPILPFPASSPRLADELVEHYAEEFQGAWQVDARDIVYADERNPIDLYRSVLKIDDARRRVFEQVGGSLIVLSPIGSKALAIGALMAAIERDFTVMYVESAGYRVDFVKMEHIRQREPSDIVHVWLTGEAYVQEGRRGRGDEERQ